MLFGFNGDPLIMGVALSSRIFPLVPSPAVSTYLANEFSVDHPIVNAELGGISSLEWTAKLSGTIKHAENMWPSEKPAAVSVLDGLTSNSANLAVFCFSVESFHFDCKVKLVTHDKIRRALANQ